MSALVSEWNYRMCAEALQIELDRVTAERDAARSMRAVEREETERERDAARAHVAQLREALLNARAILRTYDVSLEHGVMTQMESALAATEPKP